MKNLKTFIRTVSDSLQETPNDELRLNTMMQNIFNEKTTFESIELFEEFKKRFENELSKRNLDAQIESSDVDAYFRKTKQIEVTNPIIL